MIPGKVDIILVKFGHDDVWDKTMAWAEDQVNAGIAQSVYHWDNSPPKENIGLVSARARLEDLGEAPFFVMMDYDFQSIEVDLKGMIEAMCETRSPICQPGDGSGPPHAMPTSLPCTFFVVHRETFRERGGFDTRYHTAYSDWDIINKLGLPLEHGPSRVVGHMGTSNQNREWKRQIWSMDRTIYNSTWGSRSPAQWFIAERSTEAPPRLTT